MGHAITASRPLRLKRVHLDSFEAHRVNGTPADCVALGMHRWGHVDVVLSGINLGLNLGNSCWHSGTLAAAKQAALLGSRGIAFSTNVSDSREPDFAALEPYVVRVFELLLPIKTLSLVNVNLPEKPKGIRWTRQSVRHYDGKVVPDKDPAGRPIFWFTVTPLEGAAEGTDRWAVEHGWVSITPLRLDLTDEPTLLAPWPFRIPQQRRSRANAVNDDALPLPLRQNLNRLPEDKSRGRGRLRARESNTSTVYRAVANRHWVQNVG